VRYLTPPFALTALFIAGMWLGRPEPIRMDWYRPAPDRMPAYVMDRRP
jgi:hypothetical protein